MKDESIEVSKKNLPLRITLFALAVVVAVASFTYGVKKLSGNAEGYAAVGARADGDAPMYSAHVRLTYSFTGGSRGIRVMKNEISDAYSAALGRLYKLTDAETKFSGYEGNLADLNKRPRSCSRSSPTRWNGPNGERGTASTTRRCLPSGRASPIHRRPRNSTRFATPTQQSVCALSPTPAPTGKTACWRSSTRKTASCV